MAKINDDTTVTVPSRLHGDRTFHQVRLETRVLAVWQSYCAVCGRPFEVRAPLGASCGGAFNVVTCPAHRGVLQQGAGGRPRGSGRIDTSRSKNPRDLEYRRKRRAAEYAAEKIQPPNYLVDFVRDGCFWPE